MGLVSGVRGCCCEGLVSGVRGECCGEGLLDQESGRVCWLHQE